MEHGSTCRWNLILPNAINIEIWECFLMVSVTHWGFMWRMTMAHEVALFRSTALMSAIPCILNDTDIFTALQLNLPKSWRTLEHFFIKSNSSYAPGVIKDISAWNLVVCFHPYIADVFLNKLQYYVTAYNKNSSFIHSRWRHFHVYI